MKPLRQIPLLLAAIAGATSFTSAGLNIDIRATKLNDVPISGANTSRSVMVTHVGDVVSFDVVAVITGTNASNNDDKFVSVWGSFKSAGPVHGNLQVAIQGPIELADPIVLPGFDGSGSRVGLQQDLDGDGDLDVGSNVNSVAANFWAARYALAPAGSVAGSSTPTTGGRRIGFGTFTVSSIATGATLVNFFGRDYPTAANYFQDNVTRQERAFDGILPLTILAPEPSALALLIPALTTVATARRQRRAKIFRGGPDSVRRAAR